MENQTKKIFIGGIILLIVGSLGVASYFILNHYNSDSQLADTSTNQNQEDQQNPNSEDTTNNDTITIPEENEEPEPTDPNDNSNNPDSSVNPASQTQSSKIKIYFTNHKLDSEQIDCSAVYSVERTISVDEYPADEILNELFKGPNEREKFAGYTSWFSNETKNILKNVTIANKTAYVDLADIRDIIPNAGTSCGSAQFLSQIENTLKKNLKINAVRYAINGNPETFYEWIQIGCYDDLCDPSPFRNLK